MDKYMGLFTNEELQKLAYIRVSERAGDWPKDVLDALYVEFPTLLPYDAKIGFREKDENRGYGIGSIRLAGLAIPVIIKDYRLAPLDVAIAGGRMIPLTRESLATLISQKSAFVKLQPISQEQSFLGTFDPAMQSAAGDPIVEAPNVVGYEKAAAWISTTLDGQSYTFKNNKKSMAIMSGKDTDEEKAKKLIVAGLMKKTAGVLETLSGHVTREMRDKVLEISRTPEIRKLAKNSTAIQEAFDKVAKMRVVDKVDNIEEGMNRKIKRDIHYIYKQGQYRYTGIFGNSKVDAPVKIEGLELQSVTNFPLVKTAAGEPIPEGEKLEAITDIGVAPSAGDYGILKYADGECTLPFMVENVTYTDRSFVINGHDGFTKRNFYPLKGIEEEMDHEIDKCGTYVPMNTKFVRILVDEQNNARSVGEWENRVTRLDKLAYHVTGPQLSKYASVHNSEGTWTVHDVIWAVIATGGSDTDVEKIAKLDIDREHTIQTRLRLPIGLGKLAGLVQDEVNKYKKIDTVNPDIVKLAAYLPANDSVDAVIGLNFLSKVNIQEFIKLLPMYEEAVSSLARLLTAIRMGLEKVPEEPVQRSMKELMKVIYFLRGVKNLQKV